MAETIPSRWLRFGLTLSSQCLRQTTISRPAAHHRMVWTDLHILLIEDSPDIGELVKTFLELEGATVAGPAATVAEAKKLMTEGRPHLALVDLHLRDNHAYGLIAQLRELRVPVIVISGSIESPPPISLEGVMMLEKPFSEAQLLGCLRSLMAKNEARREPEP
jgi:DNA-binding response OmpR family regulator